MTPGEQLDHTPVQFGKYKGKTPSDIADEDPGYIIWMSEQKGLSDKVSALLVKTCKAEVLESRSRRHYGDDQGDRDW
jgi:hypothetical protein